MITSSLSRINSHEGYGNVAMNDDGTLYASVDSRRNRIHIHDMTGEHETTAVYGDGKDQLDNPRHACFVGHDSLLICDAGNSRIVEISVTGIFKRVVHHTVYSSCPYDIAYCSSSGVIAVSLLSSHSVLLLQYETGDAAPITVGAGYGAADGQLTTPYGVAFTGDGTHILVADYQNCRLSKFDASSGAFVANFSTRGKFPSNVASCSDGGIVAVLWNDEQMYEGSLVRIGADGTIGPVVCLLHDRESLSYSPFLNGVIVKHKKGGHPTLVRDAWDASLRCAWVSACVIQA
jgi:DNA-binding beta-propeller fold protein YncE